MAEQSNSNPAPQFNLPVFIPENWSITTTTLSATTLATAFVGQITIYEGTTLPTNWLWCDGSLLPTTIYPDLFLQIGYNYGGSGDNFNLPNCFNKSPYGADNTGILTATYNGSSVTTGGNKNMNPTQLATHNHSVSISPINMTQNVNVNNSNRGENYPSGPDSFKNPILGKSDLSITAGYAGNNADFLPPFCSVKYIIRVLP